MKNRILVCLATTLAIALGVSAQERPIDREGVPSNPLAQVRKSSIPEGTGPIQYDPGTPSGTREADPGYIFLGNLFDTRNGSPLSAGSIYTVQWYNGQVGAKGSSDMFLRISPDGGGSRFSSFINSVAPYAFNTVSFVGVPVIPPVFVGFYAGGGQGLGPGVPSLGYNAASYNGQGFHASQRTFSGVGRTSIPGQNITVRIVGSVVIPVELLEFEVD